MLDQRIIEDLRNQKSKLDGVARLLSASQLKAYYATFRERFGPEKLQGLDGSTLLETMHDFGTKENLTYWLEFKDDEEFPGISGSIAGGSALKYEVFKRKETGEWTTGSSLRQRVISLDEAVQIARRQRDQLLAGVRALEELPPNGSDRDYEALQERMNEVAADVNDTAWGHKYFSLLFPSKLEDFHVSHYQRFHLIKMLQLPPLGKGRYLCGGRYVAAANELDWPLNTLTTILNHRDGVPYEYWRVLVRYRQPYRDGWPTMRRGNFIGIGWEALGDLSDIIKNSESKNKISDLIAQKYPDVTNAATQTRDVFNFVARMEEGDLVVASEGTKILGIGRVVGGYMYDPSSEFPHRRSVEWLSENDSRFEDPVEANKLTDATVGEIRSPTNQIQLEKLILEPALLPKAAEPERPQVSAPRLNGLPGRIQVLLERKSQVILYGPPGTGKTYWAEKTARELAAASHFGVGFEALTNEQRFRIIGAPGTSGGLVRQCTFHPNYGYEDFLEGYRPEVTEGRMTFAQQHGIFRKVCEEALAQPTHNFYLIIDEINRGDIPRIFGELLTLLEKDKRGRSVLLPLSGEPFQVPPNIYILGTMNTADRSIALLDTALRRRFGFIELMPDSKVLSDAVVAGIPLGPWLDALNERIRKYLGQDARNLQIGHSYLLDGGRPIADFPKFARVLREDVIPLLEEYCYDDFDALAHILGDRLINTEKSEIRAELFEPANQDQLVAALLEPNPEITTSPQALTSEEEDVEEEETENNN